MINKIQIEIRYFTVLSFLFLTTISYTQTEYTPEQNDGQQNTICHQSYNMIQSTTFDIPSDVFGQMSPRQIYKRRNLSKSFEEHFDFDQSGNMTYTILHGESTNYYDDWMTKPEMTVFTRENRLIRREKPNSWGEYQTLRPNNDEEMDAFDVIAASTYTMNNNIILVPTEEELLNIGATSDEDGVYTINVEGQLGKIFYKPGNYLWTQTDVQDSDCTKNIIRLYGPVNGMYGRFALKYEKVEQPELAFDEYPITRTDESAFYNWTIQHCDEGGIEPRGVDMTKELKLYPNPVADQLFVDLPADWINAEMEVIDHRGMIRNCSMIRMDDHKMAIDTKQLPGGMYYLKLVSKNNMTTLKFVKSH